MKQENTRNFTSWPVLLLLGMLSSPILIMYLYLFIDTITNTEPGSLVPNEFTLEHWRFLWETDTGSTSVWVATRNTVIFATTNASIILGVSLTAGYALSRLNLPFRRFFLAGVLALHAFPTITLVIALFIVLQMVGLYNTLIGVIFIKSALMLPFGIWVMKGFYDTVPWEIEMAGVQDGASRFTVWRRLVLPQIQPGLIALGVFAFLDGWSEYILPQIFAPDADVQVLSVYLASLIADDQKFDFNLFKSIGLFYVVPVIILYLIFQNKLMNIYGGGSKG
ncbi:carbohydrate ABC transporter permease [Cohaesibacter gelatinilyticus]|uniref:Maltose/maltodextrin transport system permease protein MalG n=1 Tax=Cohaesibacter gelatinilyticus TaxID=372072 RepID=A0A285N8S2_9HYPH|nr:carbohydrate ABC transporter permease [Cohaesibacter gelatinilyticus]SNZ05313.1 carbohydrate ABC transporter membrane protein 2, CUT1 family [Cohaesibacter gelatinilyticus]